MSEGYTVIAKLKAAPGKADALAQLLREQAAVVRREEPGCLAYIPHRDVADPETFVFYEVYRDEAAFELHRASPHLAAFRERREREALAAGPAEVRVYRALAG
ncbi:MAG: putative quinol monooxygenase [Burkholderiales bacterium]